MSKNKLSICIPSGRDEKFTGKLINELYEQGFESNIFIVKFSPHPLSQKLSNQSSGIKYVQSNLKHATAMRNAAIPFIKTDWVLFLDDDISIPPNFIDIILDLIKRDTQGIIQGCPYKTINPQNWLSNQESILYQEGLQKYRLNGHINIIDPRILLIKHEIISKYRFNEKLIYASEGHELARRLIDDGHQIVYNEQLFVYHKNREKLNELFMQKYYHGKGRVQYINTTNISKKDFYMKSFYRHFVKIFLQWITFKKPTGQFIYQIMTNVFFWIGILMNELRKKKNENRY